MFSRYARKARPALLGAAAAALVLAVSTASGAKAGSPFRLGRANKMNKATTLTGKTTGSQLKIANTKAGSTALTLSVPAGQPPFSVSSTGKVANLNTDLLDGLDSSGFLSVTGTAADSSKLEGHASSYFLQATGTAADSSKLGGQLPGYYLPATGTAADSSKLGGHALADFYLLGDAFSLTTSANTALSATSTAAPGSAYGVKGSAANYGVVGISTSAGGYGVDGRATSGIGVRGLATDGWGVQGNHQATTGTAAGVMGRSSSNEDGAAAVQGQEEGSAPGAGSAGVYGNNTASAGFDRYGVSGNGPTGVYGTTNISNGNGVVGEANGLGGFGVEGKSQLGYAGWFQGNVNVTGTLTKGAGAFRIDHPLDPAHKYLQHSFVESPDMLDVYNGNVTTDEDGFATVRLPRWFQALNKDFRYQLTPIGQFAQAMVANEIANNRFTIQTDKPEVKVSWQVTGIRHDPYANAHRIQVEVRKPRAEQGAYVYPQGYGKPRSLEVGEKTTSR